MKISNHHLPTSYPPSTDELNKLIQVIDGEMSRREIKNELQLKGKVNFRINYL
jgi:hypothetical protein